MENKKKQRKKYVHIALSEKKKNKDFWVRKKKKKTKKKKRIVFILKKDVCTTVRYEKERKGYVWISKRVSSDDTERFPLPPSFTSVKLFVCVCGSSSFCVASSSSS